MVEGLVAIVVEIVVVVDAGRWVVGVVVVVEMIVGMGTLLVVVVIVGMIVGMGALLVAVGIVVVVVVVVGRYAVVVKEVRLLWLVVRLCLGDS